MDENELLAQLDSKEPAFTVEQSLPAPKGGRRKGPDLWNKTDWKPKTIDVEKFKRTGKSFTVSFHGRDSDIGDDIVNKFVKVANGLVNKGFTFRHYGSAQDKLQNEILGIANISVESYIPWSKYNPKITKPKALYLKEDDYQYAASLHSKFNSIPAGIRARLANEVRTMLTTDYNNPVDLILIYNISGEETISKGTKFTDLGNTTFSIRLAEKCNIPVYNLKKDDAISRLVEYLKTIN